MNNTFYHFSKGFIHEHTRPDRANHVTIHWDKINQSLAEDHLPQRFFNRMESVTPAKTLRI